MAIARTVLSAACPDRPVQEVESPTDECMEFQERLDANQPVPVTFRFGKGVTGSLFSINTIIIVEK